MTFAPFAPSVSPPGVAAGVAGASASPRAAAVAASTEPVAGIPLRDWNAVTADLVAGPKTPSAPPGTLTPAAIKALWTDLTSFPRAPSPRPTIVGARGDSIAMGDAATVVGTPPSTRPPTVARHSPEVTRRRRRGVRFMDVGDMGGLSQQHEVVIGPPDVHLNPRREVEVPSPFSRSSGFHEAPACWAGGEDPSLPIGGGLSMAISTT